MKSYDVVILGGGTSTGYVVRELVTNDYAGSVLVISSESVAPYERPALSKAYLHPPSAKVRARLPAFHTCVGSGGDRQDPQWYAKHDIDLRLRTIVTEVDTSRKEVVTKSERIGYGTLVHACGSTYCSLSDLGIGGDGLPGLYYLRQERDAKAIVAALEKLSKVKEGKMVVLGGGFIGLEVAAGASGWGVHTSVVSSGPIMRSFFPPHLVSCMTTEFKSRNISLVEGAVKEVVRHESTEMNEIRLANGKSLLCHMVVVGLGARAYNFLPDARSVGGCLAVDDAMRTSVDNVLAVGDCASPMIEQERVRLQAVDWARKSAAFAAKTICGIPYAFSYMPFNYSRMFEYTDKPVVWQFFGICRGEVMKLKTATKTVTGAFWIGDERVNGVLILGFPPPVEECDEAKRLVSVRAKVPYHGIVHAASLPSISEYDLVELRLPIGKKDWSPTSSLSASGNISPRHSPKAPKDKSTTKIPVSKIRSPRIHDASPRSQQFPHYKDSPTQKSQGGSKGSPTRRPRENRSGAGKSSSPRCGQAGIPSADKGGSPRRVQSGSPVADMGWSPFFQKRGSPRADRAGSHRPPGAESNGTPRRDGRSPVASDVGGSPRQAAKHAPTADKVGSPARAQGKHPIADRARAPHHVHGKYASADKVRNPSKSPKHTT